MLYHQRKNLRAIEEAEAQGQSFWTDRFDETARTKIWILFDRATHSDLRFAQDARSRLMISLGVPKLTAASDAFLDSDEADDLSTFLTECDDELVPSVVEAMLLSFDRRESPIPDVFNAIERQNLRAEFEAGLVDVFAEHRIAFEVIGDEMCSFSSRELHVEIVEPVLQLLADAPELNAAESAYQDALKEIAAGNAADAITDAGTALQEALSALGCEGNSLGKLGASAREMGLLAPHDVTLADAIRKILDWVSADRSESGDAHNASPATRDDAWFTVHVVGALILRLTKGGRAT